MAIIKTIPIQKAINGVFVNTSDMSIVSESEYATSGESFIIVRAIPQCKLINGIPYKADQQDSLREVMTISVDELKFWDKVNINPNLIYS